MQHVAIMAEGLMRGTRWKAIRVSGLRRVLIISDFVRVQDPRGQILLVVAWRFLF